MVLGGSAFAAGDLALADDNTLPSSELFGAGCDESESESESQATDEDADPDVDAGVHADLVADAGAGAGDSQQFFNRLKISVAPPNFASGRFQVVRMIGEGGMAQVYECLDTKLKRRVAVKCFRPATVNPRFLVRWQREAEIHSRLQHPGIVALHDYFTERQVPFMVQELVSGGTLRTLMKAQELNHMQWAVLIRDIASAVAYAHDNGVLHLDLKPTNILLVRHSLPIRSADDSVIPTIPYAPKITDFGLARLVDNNSDLSASQLFAGTPIYMPPERTRGAMQSGTPAIDIYSVGAILYEALTGRPPFRAEDVAKLFELIRNELPTPPRAIDPSIPLDLETICLKCLEKRPENRYKTMRELEEDLTSVIRAIRIRARRQSSFVRLVRWSYRRRKLASALIGGALLILAAITGLSLFALQEHKLNETTKIYNTMLTDSVQRAIDARDQANREHQEAMHQRDNARSASQEAAEKTRRLRELCLEVLLKNNEQHEEFNLLDQRYVLPEPIRSYGGQSDDIRREMAIRIIEEELIEDENTESAMLIFYLAGFGYNRNRQTELSREQYRRTIEIAHRLNQTSTLSFNGRALALKAATMMCFPDQLLGKHADVIEVLLPVWEEFRWFPGDAEMNFKIWDESARSTMMVYQSLLELGRIEEAWEAFEVYMTILENASRFFLPTANKQRIKTVDNQ
jgi:serine/threonine protein kinase